MINRRRRRRGAQADLHQRRHRRAVGDRRLRRRGSGHQDRVAGLATLELSGDGSRLYAAWPDGGAILAFDPASSAEVARYATGGGPRTLAQAGGKLWFGDRDGLGSLDLSGPQPVVTPGKQMGGTEWTTVPGLAATPGRPDLIAAAGNTYQQGFTSCWTSPRRRRPCSPRPRFTATWTWLSPPTEAGFS